MGFVFGGCFQKRRRRIDRSMIGEPTNFVHTTHVGSGDMGMGLPSVGSFLSLLLCTKSTLFKAFWQQSGANASPLWFAVKMKSNYQCG